MELGAELYAGGGHEKIMQRDIVFLIYLNRSGSTYLANQLSESPEIAVPPEGHGGLERLLGLLETDSSESERTSRLRYDLEHHRKLSAWQLDPSTTADRVTKAADELEAFYDLCDAFAERHKPGAGTVLVKGRFLQQLISRYGYSGLQRGRCVRAVFLMRDPRAIFASQKKSISTRTGLPMQVNPVTAALRWRHAAKKAEAWGRHPWGMTVRYEDLVANNAETLEEIFAFLRVEREQQGQPTARGDTSLSELIPANQRHLHTNIKKDPITDRIHAWRNDLSTSEVEIISAISGERLEKLYGNAAERHRLGAGAILRLVVWSFRQSARKLSKLVFGKRTAD